MLLRQIIIITLLCIVIVGLPLTLCYSYLLQKANAEQIIQINRYQYIEGENSASINLAEAKRIALTATSDYKVRLAANLTSIDSPEEKRIAVNAFEAITNYVYASSINEYINRFVIYNKSGLVLSAASSKQMGQSDDKTLLDEKFSKDFKTYYLNIEESLNNSNDIISFIIEIDSDSYLYMELTLDILSPLTNIKNNYIETGIILDDGRTFFLKDNIEFSEQSIFDDKDMVFHNKTKFLCAQFIPDSASFKILSTINYSSLLSSTYSIYYNSAYICLVSLLVATLLAVTLSKRITLPVQRLVKHINNINLDKIVVDESIEKGNDEFALIGKTINKMTREIEASILRKEEYYKEQKKNEIALLQSQVNPHFLYNTLESIRLMAVIQKNKGIERMVKSLVALLKDLSKGTDDIYPIEKELKLLENYVEIQKIRYLDSFEFINNISPDLFNLSIIKFTLQPIVENSIIHGIDPGKGNGIIVLDARCEEDLLIIEVSDNGCGIDDERIQELLTKESKGKMTGIGIYNVDRRIKLMFGEKYGLKIESTINKGTKIIIYLPKREYV